MTKIKVVGNRVAVADTRRVKLPPKRADQELLTEEHKRWRREVCTRAGWRCEAVDAGQRCTVRAPARMFADHIVERRDGGDPLDPANGQCLCGSHHTRKTAAQRARRMGATFAQR
ncbi:HNH endonuclease signature motif containing protein [Mesorhizobium sp. CAU 1741]|uniref:HNH endonuclease signature motif containing protein n=1 Tax=Mesorhizobium sp. CAU 1741 TaxID=3140366 RepID=UPI00325AB178